MQERGHRHPACQVRYVGINLLNCIGASVLIMCERGHVPSCSAQTSNNEKNR